MADSFNAKQKAVICGKEYYYYDLKVVAKALGFELRRLPISMRVLLENLVRHEDGQHIYTRDLQAVADWFENRKSDHEVEYFPARVLMQDFTGVPAVVDLAAMRDAAKKMGKDPKVVNPLIPVDLVIDHSVQVDKYGRGSSFEENVALEMKRNKERYEFLKWGKKAFANFRVVPPGTGICHQVNLEFLASVVCIREESDGQYIYPDTVVGTDSHTTMINGVGVLGWGVGGIEAEAAMLGQGISMVLPEVIGVKITGRVKPGVTATDVVLTITQMLRAKGVVGKFVEFYGDGLSALPLADRATISNMAPEYGATCAFFPVDGETIKYLRLSGREEESIQVVEEYCKMQGLWREDESDISYTAILSLDLAEVEASMAGPRRPQDRISLGGVPQGFEKELPSLNKDPNNTGKVFDCMGAKVHNGSVVIAAITSCTNTSNPYVMIGAGLIARKARKMGIKAQPWVKTSLAPGSQVVTEYLTQSGLQEDLDYIGFNLVGYGCTTCIGNSGPLHEELEKVISDNNLVVAAVLSGNRNFEGRVHPLVRANYLASPMLCVLYALCGDINVDLTTDPIAQDEFGNAVYMRDLWPTNQEIEEVKHSVLTPDVFRKRYADVFRGDEKWSGLKAPEGVTYDWDSSSTYIKNPPYFENFSREGVTLLDINDARILAIFGNSITTDHISPAGSIAKGSPAARYLESLGVERADFNSYGARRGNHEVMMRGTFANTRIKNKITQEVEGGYTRIEGKGDIISIYDASEFYKANGISTVVVAGKEYGTGSSRDWAAKGTKLQGVRAVIAESFERIHRSNLVGMGVLPLQFINIGVDDLGLSGTETISVYGISQMKPRQKLRCVIRYASAEVMELEVLSRIDTEVELDYIKSGGILHYVLNNLIR